MGRRKKSGGGGGANWMDTYGDMVTLLLCFFVLLYSMSDVNKEKYEILVRAFNPSAAEVSQIVIDCLSYKRDNQTVVLPLHHSHARHRMANRRRPSSKYHRY